MGEDDLEPEDLPENPTPAEILHIEKSDSDRLAGTLCNDFCREISMVKKFITKEILLHFKEKTNCAFATKSCRFAVKICKFIMKNCSFVM